MLEIPNITADTKTASSDAVQPHAVIAAPPTDTASAKRSPSSSSEPFRYRKPRPAPIDTAAAVAFNKKALKTTPPKSKDNKFIALPITNTVLVPVFPVDNKKNAPIQFVLEVHNYGPTAHQNQVLKTDADFIAKMHKDPSLLFAWLKDIRTSATDKIFETKLTELKKIIPLLQHAMAQSKLRIGSIILDALTTAPLRYTYERLYHIGFIAEFFPVAHTAMRQKFVYRWFTKHHLAKVCLDPANQLPNILGGFLAMTCHQLKISPEQLLDPTGPYKTHCESLGCQLFAFDRNKIKPFIEQALKNLNRYLQSKIIQPTAVAITQPQHANKQLAQHSDRKNTTYLHAHPAQTLFGNTRTNANISHTNPLQTYAQTSTQPPAQQPMYYCMPLPPTMVLNPYTPFTIQVVNGVHTIVPLVLYTMLPPPRPMQLMNDGATAAPATAATGTAPFSPTQT